MYFLILTKTLFETPSLLLFQKVSDIIFSGKQSTQNHFYIVGDAIPASFENTFQDDQQVTILSTQQAEQKATQIATAIVLHFGFYLKGSSALRQYFIPLSCPPFDNSNAIINNWIKQYQFKKCLKRANAVICLNEWELAFLQKRYPAQLPKFQLGHLPSEPPPVFDWLFLSETKSTLTNGSNYFLAFIPLSQLVSCLKEFSLFKKWHETTMSMVFIFESINQCEKANKVLKGYKYKDSIYIKCIQDVKMQWVAASYALLYSGDHFNKLVWLNWAIQYDVPLLLDENKDLPTAYLKAGEVFLFSMPLALSNHMKLYYKDEVYRQVRAGVGTAWLSELRKTIPPSPYLKIPVDLISLK